MPLGVIDRAHLSRPAGAGRRAGLDSYHPAAVDSPRRTTVADPSLPACTTVPAILAPAPFPGLQICFVTPMRIRTTVDDSPPAVRCVGKDRRTAGHHPSASPPQVPAMESFEGELVTPAATATPPPAVVLVLAPWPAVME